MIQVGDKSLEFMFDIQVWDLFWGFMFEIGV